MSVGRLSALQARVLRVLDGVNLSDERDPVSESEFGDAQHYRLPARTVLTTFVWRK